MSLLTALRNTLYIRFDAEHIVLRHVESGREVTEVPWLATEQRRGKPTVVAVGRLAIGRTGQSGIHVANGFQHPRTPIADFGVAELTLRHLMKPLVGTTLFAVSPTIVLHPRGDYAGGLTQVEIRAMAELGMGAGARKVFVWQGANLPDPLLRELRFDRANGRLLYPSHEP